MPLDPLLAPFVPVPPLPDDVDFAATREADNANVDLITPQFAEPGPAVAETRTIRIPVIDGEIDVLLYRPEGDGILPAHLYFHGGGWVTGTAHNLLIDTIARERAVGAQCLVLTVDYRKAPEHRAPTALLDCQAALLWLDAHADELGVDRTRISVGGGSAGANLAAALTLKNRDENGPALAFQLLEVPAVDLTLSLPSHSDPELGSLYGLHRATLEASVAGYLGPDGDPRDPLVSPLLAEDHRGLPTAHIMSAEFDVLRDDSAEYSRVLTAAGVAATHSVQLGHVHHSSMFTKLVPAARAWRDEAVGVLRTALHP